MNTTTQELIYLSPTGEIDLTVDYSQTLEQMIADGLYDRKSKDITTENFPFFYEMMSRKVKLAAKLFRFDLSIGKGTAITEMRKDGYRPATLPELLALGKVEPNLQRKYSIVSLGSNYIRDSDGRFGVPYLSHDDNGRCILLDFFISMWSPSTCFLGIRKKDP